MTILMWLGLAVVCAGYERAVARQRRRGKRWSAWRTVAFFAGAVVVAAAVSPPLARAVHHDLRAHAVQHVLVGMLAPLGLVLAAPVALLLRTVPVAAARRITLVLSTRPARVLTHPFTALVLDVGVLYALHLTPAHARAQASPVLHGLLLVHFLAAGTLFTWAVAGPERVPGRRRFRVRLAALFLAIAAHSTLAKVMYAYGLPGGGPAGAEEVRAAAKILYYGGDVAELLLAVALFAGWRSSGSQTRGSAGHRAAGNAGGQ